MECIKIVGTVHTVEESKEIESLARIVLYSHRVQQLGRMARVLMDGGTIAFPIEPEDATTIRE